MVTSFFELEVINNAMHFTHNSKSGLDCIIASSMDYTLLTWSVRFTPVPMPP